MRSVLTPDDCTTLKLIRERAERILSRDNSGTAAYKSLEAQVMLNGIYLIESIESRFDFYTGDGKILPEILLSSELNISDPDCWLREVCELPLIFPWDGSEVYPDAFDGVNQCLKIIAKQLVCIAPNRNTMEFQDSVSLLHNDVFKYMSGNRSNEDLARNYHWSLSAIQNIRIDLGRIETKRRELILKSPHAVRIKRSASDLIPNLVPIPRGHQDVDYYARLARRYRQLEEHWDEILPSEFCGYDYDMRWEVDEVESVVGAASAIKTLRRELEAKQINSRRPIAHHFNIKCSTVETIFKTLHDYAFNQRTRKHRIFRSVLEAFVSEDLECFLGMAPEITLLSFREFAQCCDHFLSPVHAKTKQSRIDTYDTMKRKYEAFTEELKEAEQWLRPIFYHNDFETEESYENIEGGIKISNKDLENMNDFLEKLPDNLRSTRGLVFESGLKFKDALNPNAVIMDGMLLGLNWFHYWTSGGPDGIQELLGKNRTEWYCLFSLLGKKFVFLKELAEDANDAFDEYVNFIQDSNRFKINDAAAEVTRQELLKKFRSVLLDISRLGAKYWEKPCKGTCRAGLTIKNQRTLNVSAIVKATSIEVSKELNPQLAKIQQVQEKTNTEIKKTRNAVNHSAKEIRQEGKKIKSGVKKLLKCYDEDVELTDHDKKFSYRPRVTGLSLTMLEEAYALYQKGMKRGTAAAFIYRKYEHKKHKYSQKECFTTAVFRFCDGKEKEKKKISN